MVSTKRSLIAHLSDIRMFNIRYLIMHKVHMHAGAIRQILYGCAHVREIIHSLKLVDYPPVHTHKPYNNLHLVRTGNGGENLIGSGINFQPGETQTCVLS